MKIATPNPPFSTKQNVYKDFIKAKLVKADVLINGTRSSNVQVHDDSFYGCLFNKGSLGLGESYMNGLWDCENLDDLLFKILKANLDNESAIDLLTLTYLLRSRLLNRQSGNRVYEVAKNIMI